MSDSLLLRSESDLSLIARSNPVRWTHLQHFFTSPQHYLQSFDGIKETPAIRIGRAVDTYVLGGEEPLIYDEGKRQGTRWERFRAFHAGREILSLAENDAARYMADAIDASRDAMAVLNGGAAHPEINWQRGNRQCLSHPDYVAPSFVTELKVCHTANPLYFPSFAARERYPEQLAFYDEAVRFAGIATPREWYIVVAENNHDGRYPVTVFRPNATSRELATLSVDDAMSRLSRCEARNDWPSYAPGVVDFERIA